MGGEVFSVRWSVSGFGFRGEMSLRKTWPKAQMKIQYTDEPMGDLKVVRDFLPPPHEHVFE